MDLGHSRPCGERSHHRCERARRDALKLLSKPFYLCCKVRIATDPVGRVCAGQNPDVVIRLGPPRIPHSLLRAFACNSLTANLGREHVLGRLPGGPCDRKKAFLLQGQASEDRRKQKHEISTRSHDGPCGMAETIVGAFSCGFAQKAAIQTKRALLSAIVGQSILCGYAKTAGERNQQVWRRRHSLPGDSGRPWGLPFLHRRTVAVPRYAYPGLSHRMRDSSY
jgi:hypothetical protein